MPNWTAMRYKFKRSRRAQFLAGLLALIVLFILNSIVASFFRPDAPTAGNLPPGTSPDSTTRIEVAQAPVEWRSGDYWVWEDGHGLRITDRVLDVTYAGNGTNRVALYHVQRESSAADGVAARIDNITYDSRTLSVVEHENERYTVEWRARTLGLTYFVQDGGYVSNATVTLSSGREIRWYRVANVTETLTTPVTVPAGRFDDVKAATIQYYDLDIQDAETARIVSWSHWYSPAVANDVRFTLTNGTLMKLVGFRAKGGFVPAPEPVDTPRWRVGQTWTYEDGSGAERKVEVTEAKGGVVTVRTTVTSDTTNVEDTAHHRASDLALLDYTTSGVPFRMDPAGVPLNPENGTFAYTKYVDAAGPERPFTGNATVGVRDGAVIATAVGDIPARRIVIVEQERGPNGERAAFQTVRYYAASVANDVRIIESGGRTWTLTSYDLGPRPLRGDTLPPP